VDRFFDWDLIWDSLPDILDVFRGIPSSSR
jgi:hypothetical protein